MPKTIEKVSGNRWVARSGSKPLVERYLDGEVDMGTVVRETPKVAVKIDTSKLISELDKRCAPSKKDSYK